MVRPASHETPRATRLTPWTGRGRTTVAAPQLVAGAINAIEEEGVRWINIEHPTSASIDYLRANFSFHEFDLDDILDTVQRPKLDEYDDYLFVVVQFPVHSKLTRVTTASEVDIFVGHDYVITLHDARLKPLGRLFDEAERSPETRAALFSGGADRLFYRILDQLIDYCFPIARRIMQHIEHIDDIIFEPNSLRTVQEIATVRRDIIACRRIIKPLVPLMALLEKRARLFFDRRDEDIDIYFGDLSDHISKLWDIMEDARDVVESLSATADSITSHRLNEVIKILTIFSVVMLPLTLVSSIYGMNVPLPRDQNERAFVELLALMALIAISMLAFFRWRRWI